MPAKLSLQCEHRDNQYQDCRQVSIRFRGHMAVNYRRAFPTCGRLEWPLYYSCRTGWLCLSEQSR